jgi:ParB family transcriptional regulator, chromosome partitioning protein
MTTKKRHLGRGLSALLGEDVAAAVADTPPGAAENAGAGAAHGVAQDSAGHSAGQGAGQAPGLPGQRYLPIERLNPGRFQPRTTFDEKALGELAQSIRAQGVLQPILVRRHPSLSGEFEILAGERRWRAAQLAQLHDVPVIEKNVDDRAALEIALIENLQRTDLNAIEQAEAYRRLGAEFSYTQEQLAEQLGKSRPHVANMLRLLSLPASVKAMIAEGKLLAGHARALVTAPDPAALARRVWEEGLSVRETELQAALALDDRDIRNLPGARIGRKRRGKDANTMALERDLSRGLGVKVEIAFDGKGGRVVIHYKSLDQFEDLVKRLKG